MNKYLSFKGIAIVFCIFTFFACNQRKVNNVDEGIKTEEKFEYQQNSEKESGKTTCSFEYDEATFPSELTALPFDLDEWVEWQTAIDMTVKDDDGRYNWTLLSENESLKQLVDAVFPQFLNIHYFILKSDKTECTMYIIVSTKIGRRGSLYFSLINFRDNEKIDSLSLGALLGGNERQSFNISENLEITLFDVEIGYEGENTYRYIDGEEHLIPAIPVIVGKQITGRYQIQRDGRIVKIDDLN